MTIELKDDKEIKAMEESNRIVAVILKELEDIIEPGISTHDIDAFADKRISQLNAKPAFKGYRGFPATACVSVNEEIVHGIPGNRILKDGDIVSVDIGAFYNNFYGDACCTYYVGSVSADAKRLVEATKKALYMGIEQCRRGNRLGQVSKAIYDVAVENNLGVIRTFVGHGIGRSLHEDPQVPNYVGPWSSFILDKGLVLSLEPMFCLGDYRVSIMKDGWTAITRDRSLASHFEHTVAVTDDEAKILSLPETIEKKE